MPAFDPLVMRILLTIAAGLGGLLISFLLGFIVQRRHDRRPIELGGYELHIRLLRAPIQLLLPAVFILGAQP